MFDHILTEKEYNDLNPEDQNKYKIWESSEEGQKALNAAKRTASKVTNSNSSNLSEQGADVIGNSETLTEQKGQSETVSLNKGTNVTQQQGRSESYTQDNYTPEELEEFNKRYLPLHNRFTFDEKGEVIRNPNSTFYDAIGVDREKLRGERDRQERIQRMRKLEHGLANSAMLISDMISAGIGGNVYKRDKDKTNEEADKDIARLREEQIADDMAAKMQDIQDQEKWSADYWKAFNEWRKEKQKHISENSSTGSQESVQQGQQVTTNQQSSKSNTVQTSKSTPEYLAATHKGGLTVDKNGNLIFGGGGGGKGTAVANVRVTTANGEELQQIYLPDYAREELVNTAHTLLQEAINTGEISADDLKGFYTPERKNGTKLEPAKWNDDNLLSSEIVLRQPRILNTFINKIIEQGYEINGKPISRADAYMLITGINPYGTDGKIDANKVLHGIVLDGVAGRSAVNGDGTAGMFN